jgi:membrane protein
VLNQVLSLVVITALFAALFKVLPDATVAWRDVWVGAAVTAVLVVVGKFLIGLYLGRSNPGQAFGAAGSLAVLLVWIYYSSMILLFGAEFTQTWAERRGKGIQPERGAVRVIQEKRRVSGGSAAPA